MLDVRSYYLSENEFIVTILCFYVSYQARLWNAAHEVTVKQIAPDAIINDNYSYLYDLLHELSSATSIEGFKEDSALKSEEQTHSTKIIDWNSKGRVFYDFINIDMEIKELLKKRDEQSVGYHIEKLRPQVKYF